MLNMDKSNCQRPTVSAVSRSVLAEELARTHVPSRCSDHSLFHNWTPVTGDALRELNNKRTHVRSDGYHEFAPGKWKMVDRKPGTKKSDID